MTTYQKLKHENDKLKQDLMHLVNYPESVRSAQIKLEWMLKKKMEDAIWAGNPNPQH
jgi:hypothetical protein